MSEIVLESPGLKKRVAVSRHGLIVRITHWINALVWVFLLMSGLQIFNAHPALYFGKQSDFAHPFLAMGAADDNPARGITTIGGHSFDTTGWLGVSYDANGQPMERGFPRFVTWPGEQDLATGRRWHFFLAWLFVINGAIYLLSGALSRHFARDLWPSWSDIRHIPRSIVDHVRLKFPHERRYNVLQKLAYVSAALVALPLMVLTGLTMSPAMDAAFPWLLDIFGGRQSARSIHFITAMFLVLFVVVHLVMVLISGVFNNLRSMITGRYIIEEKAHDGSR